MKQETSQSATSALQQVKSAYISLEQPELVNLSQALSNEFLSTNHSGGYMSTTVALCNTRKYHGLMVLPLDHFGGERHVLLSTLDETLIIDGQEFHLAVRRFPGLYDPRGHKYLVHFQLSPTPTFTYRVGDIVIQKELLFAHTQEHFMVRYTLLEGKGSLQLKIRPFLAFRNSHALSRANMAANVKYAPSPNGMHCRMYTGFPTLHLQTNTASTYTHAPDWHYNVEYSEELARGYDGHEDLYVPGYFECTLRGGPGLILSASTEAREPRQLMRTFNKELEARPKRDDFISTLQAAAGQFLADEGARMRIIAGYPWFGRWGRDTLIALPGLTLSAGNVEAFERVLSTLTDEMRGGLLPNMGSLRAPAFNSVDAPLWLFITVQRYCEHTGDYARAWKLWGKALKSTFGLLQTDGKLPYRIGMKENGLIWAGEPGWALTWMDAVVDGMPVTPRTGYAVEINALWHNAIRFMEELYEKVGKSHLAAPLDALASKVAESFRQTFWLEDKGYLADYVDESHVDTAVRPNQIFSVCLPYTPLNEEQQNGVVETVRRELYTPLGLRTLSPKNPKYQPIYHGGQAQRDSAYHQGTIWPWLLEAYVCAVYRVKGERGGQAVSREILTHIEHEMPRYGLGSVGEVFDGDPPHYPGGTYAQAWSVAAIMGIAELLYPERYNTPRSAKKK